MHNDTLRAILKQKGFSLTRPRKLVFGLLLKGEPQSIGELVSQAEGKIDRATVYRVIELFENLGIVHRVNTGWKHKIELSDAFVGHHHHLHCAGCGRSFPLPANTMLETMIDTAAVKENFSPRSHQLEIYGLCVNCSKS